MLIVLVGDVVDVGATVVGTVGAAAAEVVTPQSSSMLLPDALLASRRLRHGGASGFFGFPRAIASRYAAQSASPAGPVTSGPTPRTWPPADVGAAAAEVVVAPPMVVAAPDAEAVVVAPEVVAPFVDAVVVAVDDDVVVDVSSPCSFSSLPSCSSPAAADFWSWLSDAPGRFRPTCDAVLATTLWTGSGR